MRYITYEVSLGWSPTKGDSLLSPILESGICEVMDAVCNLSMPSVPEIGLDNQLMLIDTTSLAYPGAMTLLLTPLGPSSTAKA